MEVGSSLVADERGPKSAGLDEASDMLLGCPIGVLRRACDSIGDDGLLRTFLAEVDGGLSPISSMLLIDCCGGGAVGPRMG